MTKTVSSVFHLHSANTSRELNGQHLKQDAHPIYRGITCTLDRSLTFRVHLQRTDLKVAARINNLTSKLACTNWGANATSFRTSDFALCYSTAEYCALVWSDSVHCNLIDTQLKQTMRIITGANSGQLTVSHEQHCSTSHSS